MPTTRDNFNKFYAAEAKLQSASPDTINGRSVYRFQGSSVDKIPFHVRTGQQTMGDPVERKRFTQVEFHGKGTLWARFYIDGVFVWEEAATLTENPSKDRRIGLPIGLRGYALDVEFCGDAEIRAVEFTFKPMARPS